MCPAQHGWTTELFAVIRADHLRKRTLLCDLLCTIVQRACDWPINLVGAIFYIDHTATVAPMAIRLLRPRLFVYRTTSRRACAVTAFFVIPRGSLRALKVIRQGAFLIAHFRFLILLDAWHRSHSCHQTYYAQIKALLREAMATTKLFNR